MSKRIRRKQENKNIAGNRGIPIDKMSQVT